MVNFASLSKQKRTSADPVKLTGPESSAQSEQMQAHKEFKCARCLGRFDFDTGIFACLKDLNAEWVMKNDKTCKRFSLNDDCSDWRDDIA